MQDYFLNSTADACLASQFLRGPSGTSSLRRVIFALGYNPDFRVSITFAVFPQLA